MTPPLQTDIHARTRLLLGNDAIKTLQNTTILVAGCGAVGSFALEALARSGVGRLIVVDFDTISASNINRQLFATHTTVGLFKTAVAAARLKDINPHLEIIEKRILINSSTIETLFDIPFDFAIDAIDSLTPKTLLISSFLEKNIPFISAMGAALKTDISRIRVSRMDKTIQCPLAAFIRKRLRRKNVPLKFPVVWSDECVSDKLHLGEKEPDSPGKRGRHEMGSLVTITGMFGLICAQEAIAQLTKTIKK